MINQQGLQVAVTCGRHHNSKHSEWQARAYVDGEYIALGFGATQLNALKDVCRAIEATKALEPKTEYE